MDIEPLYNDEVQLMAWGDSNAQGPWIKVRLYDSSHLDHFRALTMAKGDKAGQRIAMTMVLIGDDEKPLPPPGAKPEDRPLGGPLAKLAGMWCADERFLRWLNLTFPLCCTQVATEFEGRSLDEATAEVVRRVCQIASRAELDHSPEAAERFHGLIREPYSAYLKTLPAPDDAHLR